MIICGIWSQTYGLEWSSNLRGFICDFWLFVISVAVNVVRVDRQQMIHGLTLRVPTVLWTRIHIQHLTASELWDYVCVQDLPYFADENYLHRVFVSKSLTSWDEQNQSSSKRALLSGFLMLIWELTWPWCADTGSLVSVKVMRNKSTQISLGYGFLEFSSHEAASEVLEQYNNTPMPGTHSNFRYIAETTFYFSQGHFGVQRPTSTIARQT